MPRKKSKPTVGNEDVLIVTGVNQQSLYAVRRLVTVRREDGKEEQVYVTFISDTNPIDSKLTTYDVTALTDETVKVFAQKLVGLQRKRRTR